ASDNLLTTDACQDQVKSIQRQGAQQEQGDLQQAAEQLAQDNLVVAEVRQEEQYEGAPVFFQSDRAGRGQGGEKQDEGQLHVEEHLELEQAETGQVAQRGRLL